MTTKKVSPGNNKASNTIAFEPLLYENLRNLTFMAYFLADALNDTQDKHAVETALKHIIKANHDNCLPSLIAIHFGLTKLNHSQLERIIDFMEEEIAPQARVVLTADDVFVNLRKLVTEIHRHGRPPDQVRLEIKREPASTPSVSPLEARLNAIKNSLQREYGEAFSEVESALAVA